MSCHRYVALRPSCTAVRCKPARLNRCSLPQRVYVMHGRPLLSRVYRFFGLRHGTMMIAIHDLVSLAATTKYRHFGNCSAIH